MEEKMRIIGWVNNVISWGIDTGFWLGDRPIYGVDPRGPRAQEQATNKHLGFGRRLFSPYVTAYLLTRLGALEQESWAEASSCKSWDDPTISTVVLLDFVRL